jgi:hypothetical protein
MEPIDVGHSSENVGTTGATPKLSAVRLVEATRLPSIMLSEGAKSPGAAGGKSPRPDEHFAGACAQKVPRLEADVDAASASRVSSRLASVDEASNDISAAMALATGGAEDPESVIQGDNEEKEDGEGEGEDSSDGEDAFLTRMLRQHQQQHQRPSLAAQQQLRLSPGRSSGTPGAAACVAGSAAVGSPKQPGAMATAAADGAAAESGWDAVVGSASRRRSRSSALAASPGDAASAGEASSAASAAAAATPPQTPQKGAAAEGADDDSEGDELLGGAYYSAKDASRRKNGKHGRSVKQATQRQYAVEARQEQRAASTRGRRHTL